MSQFIGVKFVRKEIKKLEQSSRHKRIPDKRTKLCVQNMLTSRVDSHTTFKALKASNFNPFSKTFRNMCLDRKFNYNWEQSPLIFHELILPFWWAACNKCFYRFRCFKSFKQFNTLLCFPSSFTTRTYVIHILRFYLASGADVDNSKEFSSSSRCGNYYFIINILNSGAEKGKANLRSFVPRA